MKQPARLRGIRARRLDLERNRMKEQRTLSPHAVAGLCVTIGRYWYLFKRLTAV